ncbi:MAG: c-type cytochrome [Geminicoccaceae bacterium]
MTASFDYSLIVWRLADETVQSRLLGHDGPVNAVALSADGTMAVSASDDGSVGVWDVAGGTLLRRLPTDTKLGVVALSPDGLQVAAGGWNSLLYRWRLSDGAAAPLLDNNGERVTALAFTADGAFLLAGGHEGSLQIWRTVDDVPSQRIHAHDFAVAGLAVQPHGGVVTGSLDGSLRRWTLVSDKGPAELVADQQPIAALAVSRDGRFLASAGTRGEVLVWQTNVDHPHLVLADTRAAIWALAFTPDGDHLLAGGADGAVRVWDLATGALSGHPVPSATQPGNGRGPQLFAKCTACHSLSADGGNKAGPPLSGLFGRPAGSVAGYAYSPALRASGIVWTEATVARLFDVGPDRFVPGSKMPLQRLVNPSDRAALIDYLKRMGGAAGPKQSGSTSR